MIQLESQLKQSLNSTTDPTQLKALSLRIAGLQYKLNEAYFSILQQHFIANDWQSAINFVNTYSLEDLNPEELLVELYMRQQNIAAAQQILQNMNVLNSRNSTFKDYWNLRLQLYQNGKNWNELNAQEEQTLRSIANSVSPLAVKAQKILHYVFDEPYTPPLPIRATSTAYKNPVQTTPLLETASQLTLVPNPNRGQTVLHIAGHISISEQSQIQLLDLNGRVLKVYDCPKDRKQVHLDTSTLENGLYFCILVSDGKPIHHTKMSIVK